MKPNNSDEIEWSCHMVERSQRRCSSFVIAWFAFIFSSYKPGKTNSQASKWGTIMNDQIHKQCSWLCTMNTNEEDRRSTYRYILHPVFVQSVSTATTATFSTHIGRVLQPSLPSRARQGHFDWMMQRMWRMKSCIMTKLSS